MSEQLDSDAPKTHPSLGKWITRCGPKGKSSSFGLFILFGFIAAGVFLIIVGFTVTPQPGSEIMPTLMKGAGCVMIALGAACLLYVALWRGKQIDLYSGGLRYKLKDDEQFIAWTEMSYVLVTTIYDTAASNFRTVKISRKGQKDLSFESRLQGESDRIINSILKSAPNVEEKEVSMGA